MGLAHPTSVIETIPALLFGIRGLGRCQVASRATAPLRKRRSGDAPSVKHAYFLRSAAHVAQTQAQTLRRPGVDLFLSCSFAIEVLPHAAGG